MKEFWDNRYSKEEYAYGVEPNIFFKEVIDSLTTKGKVLFPAEGEGRNSVYAAKLGWDSFAFDISIEGKKKAIELASTNSVSINYEVSDFESYTPSNQFDLLVLSYCHVPASKRKEYYQKCISWLSQGGTLVLEGFSKKQLGLTSGGPKKEDMLYSIVELREEFKGVSFDILKEERIVLREGKFHQGNAEVIRLIGTKL